MRPHEFDDMRNGDAGMESGSSSSSEGAEELSLSDPGAPARTLAALNQLRKSRQHYDAVLVARGEEIPVHAAVLGAASPRLLAELGSGGGGAGGGAVTLRLDEAVEPDAVRGLVEFAYTGQLRVADAAAARRLLTAAALLRLETPRRHLAAALLRALTPGGCLRVRALPGLEPPQRAELDQYISDNFEAVTAAGALGTLPQLSVELVCAEGGEGEGEGGSGEGKGETDAAVADAVQAWLSHLPPTTLDELCRRTHLLFVDGRGRLRDCGELPPAPPSAPELRRYQAERAARHSPPPHDTSSGCSLVAWRGGAGATRVLVAAPGGVALGRVSRRGVAGAPPSAPLPRAARPACLAEPRAGHAAAVLGGRLLVVGGYDRARVLLSAEVLADGAWRAAPALAAGRARCAGAAADGALLLLGGSDGHQELDLVTEYTLEHGGRALGRLPSARSHAGAALGPRGALLAGGWSAGRGLRAVCERRARAAAWDELAPLQAARSQCGVAYWEGALWAIGGCDSWHCLASTERLPYTDDGWASEWEAGPALPTARRAMCVAAWRGRLVAAGGSDGACSLRRVDWLTVGGDSWLPGPALASPRANAALAVLDDVLYAVGGYSGKEFLSCTECLYSPEGPWVCLQASPAPDAPLAEREQEPLLQKAKKTEEETQKVENGKETHA